MFGGITKMQADYINSIIQLLHKCNDTELLDLILKLLQKSG